MKKLVLLFLVFCSFAVNAQTVTNTVTLDGSASSDADGSITAYSWKQLSGPATTEITDANTVKGTVVYTTPGLYAYELTVTDNKGKTGKGIQEVEVLDVNKAPVARTNARIVIQLPDSK